MVRAIPKDLYSALYQTWVTKVITEAIKIANIPEDQRDYVDLVVVQVFTGEIPPRDVAKYLSDWLRIDPKNAFRAAQHITENLINKQKDYLTNHFGTGYFSPAGDAEVKKPRETTPKLDGNIVNLRSG